MSTRLLSLSLLSAGALLACSRSHAPPPPLDGTLEPIGSVELSVGWPQRVVTGPEGFVAVTGGDIPDGIVPATAWTIGLDGAARSRELAWECPGRWWLQASEDVRLICYEGPRDPQRFTHAALSPDDGLLGPARVLDPPGGVDAVVLEDDAAWLADFWVEEPERSVRVTEVDLETGRTRSTVEQGYDWMRQAPVLRPGSPGPWLATVDDTPEDGPTLTVRNLRSGLVQSTPTCVASHSRDGLELLELAPDRVATLELCEGAVFVSTHDVRTGEVRTVALDDGASDAFEAPAMLARADEHLVVVYGRRERGQAHVRVLDDDLAVRAEAHLEGTPRGLAARSDLIALLDATYPSRVQLLRLTL
ncbi:MAG: hypothetical protein CMN29_24560 [Sandaracinus sp.]|nr:hypothetical protein [Sandaracinus sp.]